MHRSLDASSSGSATYCLKGIGQKYLHGVSSRYEDVYNPILENVVSEKELSRIIEDLNEILVSHWPCGPCYTCGYLCTPCTFMLSLVGPGYCASQAETEGQKFLRNVSLTARFYDRSINFTIVKNICDSYVEIRFPTNLVPRRNFVSSVDLESGNSNAHITLSGGYLSKGADSGSNLDSSERSPLLNSMTGGKRIKDN